MSTGSGDQKRIGRRIADERVRAQLSQAALAAAVGLPDHSAVSRIENGDRRVSALELVKIAGALGVPLPWLVASPPAAVLARRSGTSASTDQLDRSLDKHSFDVAQLVSAGVVPRHNLVVSPRAELTDYPSAEQLANLARQNLGLEPGPLHNLQSAVERAGLFAFSESLGATGPEGAFTSTDSGYGVAVINGSHDPAKRRFTLAHEFGHFLAGDQYSNAVSYSGARQHEKILNAFAIYLLLPRNAVTKQWRDSLKEFSGDSRLAAVVISARYRASWSATCLHLFNLNLINDGLHTRLLEAKPSQPEAAVVGEHWESELEPPGVPEGYAGHVLASFRSGAITSDRTIELLNGTLSIADLPPPESSGEYSSVVGDFAPMDQ